MAGTSMAAGAAARAVIGLGANLGDAPAALRTAIAGLAATPGVEVTAVSGLWRTAAVGGPTQPDYCNCVAVVTTELSPAQLLGVCHRLERAAGRERLVRWGPRTLDLDIVSYQGVSSQDPELTLPHPRAHERAFVLAPWAQVAPADILVADGRAATVAEWLESVAHQRAQPDPDLDWWR